MIVRKPTVIIYTRDPDEDFLREICVGIEEEGVLYEIHSRDADMDELAFEAAKILCLVQELVLQSAGLPCRWQSFQKEKMYLS